MQYIVLGKEQQVINIVLAPGKFIYVIDLSVICCSEDIIKLNKQSSSIFEHSKTKPVLVKLLNTSEGMGYMTLNYKGGKVLVLDIKKMEDLAFDEEYVVAFTSNVSLSTWK
jgi:uncharacterized protein (AIM24 family)